MSIQTILHFQLFQMTCIRHYRRIHDSPTPYQNRRPPTGPPSVIVGLGGGDATRGGGGEEMRDVAGDKVDGLDQQLVLDVGNHLHTNIHIHIHTSHNIHTYMHTYIMNG